MYRDERDAWVNRIIDGVDYANTRYLLIEENMMGDMYESHIDPARYNMQYDEVTEYISQYDEDICPFRYNSRAHMWYRPTAEQIIKIMSYDIFASLYCSMDIEWGPQNTEMQQILNGLLDRTGLDCDLSFAMYYSLKLYNMRTATLNPTSIETSRGRKNIGGIIEMKFKVGGSNRLVLAERLDVPEPIERPRE